MGETVLGALHAADATANATLRDLARGWLDGYALRYDRGTQARSLAAAIVAAIELDDLDEARRMGDALLRYQIPTGGVKSDPEGRATVDATAMAVRAFGALRDADPARDWDAPLRAAAGSLRPAASGLGVQIAQADGSAEETDDWAFKSALVLQAGDLVAPEARWAARTKLWASVRDVARFDVRTSIYSAETNSETQAWALLGLRMDPAPSIVAAEGVWGVPRALPDGSMVTAPPWPGARAWVDASWTAWAPRLAGPMGTTRVAPEDDLRLWPARVEGFAEGLRPLSFPGLDHPLALRDALAALAAGIYIVAARLRVKGATP